jgi:type II secretory pathway component GspD/PulD (secretin)
MKRQLIITTLGTLMVSALIAHAQDAAPAAAATETAASEAAPAVIVADAATTPAAEPAPAPAPAPAAAPAAAEAPAAAGAEAQLIVIDDTPLLDAIRNLARQAGLNLMIDPKVAFGQADPTKPGTVTAQPSVSIRWENITAEQALNALLNNYNLQAIEDPKVKITRVTVKDPAMPDPLVTKTIQLQFASPTNLVGIVTASLSDKRSKVVADVRTSQIVVVTTEKELVEVEKLVAKLDTKTKQVLIEAKIIEANLNPKTSKGIDWTGTLSGQKMAMGNNVSQAGRYSVESEDPVVGSIQTVTYGAPQTLGTPRLLLDTAKGLNPTTASWMLMA